MVKHRGNKLKNVSEDRKTFYTHKVVGFIWKWLSYQKQSVHSMQSSSKFKCNSSKK